MKIQINISTVWNIQKKTFWTKERKDWLFNGLLMYNVRFSIEILIEDIKPVRTDSLNIGLNQ